MKFGILDYSVETSVETEVIGSNGDIICYNCSSENELPDDIQGLDAVMVWHHINVSENLLKRLSNCKVLVRVGVGFDSVDYKFAGSIGIPVVNIPDYGTNDVADHAFSLLLSVCRKTFVYNNAILQDPIANWKPEIGKNIHRLTEKTLGIIGMGRIGTAVATRAKAFGMNTVFYDPYLTDGYDKAYQSRRMESLEEILSVSDYISVHVPAAEDTIGMINKSVLQYMKKGLTLINTSRGSVVSLDAVYDGLKEGIIENFAADVLEREPPDTENILIKAYINREPWLEGRMLVTPHTAFYAVESVYEMRKKAAIQMLNAVTGTPIRNCINIPYLVNARSAVATYSLSL